MNILWIGCHEEGIPAFRQTLESGNQISAFITLDEEAFAKRSAGSREYAQYCEQYGVPIYNVSTIKGDRAYEIISQYKPDLMVVLGWSEILPQRILEIPTVGTVGTHAALLPHNRGSAPINWALIHGEEVTGNTMMWLDAQVDAGAIVDQAAFPITVFDTCKTLYDQVAQTNADMLLKLIAALKEGKKPVLPIANETDEPILPRRRPKDGLINWQQGARAIYDFVRALTVPYPGAFTYLRGEKWLLWEAAVLPVSAPAEPGTILGTSYGFGENAVGLTVATADGCLLVTCMEDEAGKRYTGKELYEMNLKGVFGDA